MDELDILGHLRVCVFGQKTPGNFQEPGTDSAVSVCSRLLSHNFEFLDVEEDANLKLSVRMRSGRWRIRKGGEKGALAGEMR